MVIHINCKEYIINTIKSDYVSTVQWRDEDPDPSGFGHSFFRNLKRVFVHIIDGNLHMWIWDGGDIHTNIPSGFLNTSKRDPVLFKVCLDLQPWWGEGIYDITWAPAGF